MPERNKGGQFIIGLQQQQYRDGPNGYLPPKRNMSNPADHPYILDAWLCFSFQLILMTKFNTHQTRDLFLYLIQHDDLLHVVNVNTSKFVVYFEKLLDVCFL